MIPEIAREKASFGESTYGDPVVEIKLGVETSEPVIGSPVTDKPWVS